MPDGAQSDIVVIGGGVIGLSIAWSLIKEGVSVTVIEAGQIGCQSSGAAAGMLAPLAEAHEPSPFCTLGLESLERYPAFVADLLEESGIDPELIGPGMLRIAMNDEEAYELGQDWDWQQSLGLTSDCLSSKEARLLEPALPAEVRLAVRSPEERNVEPKRLVRAIALACSRRGVRIVEGEPVVEFERERDRVSGVMSPGQHFACDGVVIAGGAWSELLGRRLDCTIPIYPIRGQILSLMCLPPPIRHTIYGKSGYLVPKSDGRVVVGATEDESGFDARNTAGGVAGLLSMASGLVSELRTAAFDTAWAGLRPASADGMPILGRLPGWKNAYSACGHFRNGILLAPITGEIMSHEIIEGKPHSLTESFRPDRFVTPVNRVEAD